MNLFFDNVLLQTAVPPGAQSGQFFSMLVTFGLVILIFYFLIIRPQNKRQKETKLMLENIKKGDRVVTIGGIRGTVFNVKDDAIVLKVDDEAKIEFIKSAIANVIDKKDVVKKEEAKKGK